MVGARWQARVGGGKLGAFCWCVAGVDEPAGESNPVRQVCGVGHGWANASWGRAERGVGEARGKARDGKRASEGGRQ